MAGWTTKSVFEMYREANGLQNTLTQAMQEGQAKPPPTLEYRCWELHRLLQVKPKEQEWGKALHDDDVTALTGAGFDHWGVEAATKGLIPTNFLKSTAPTVQVELIAQRAFEYINRTKPEWTIDEVADAYRPIIDLGGTLASGPGSGGGIDHTVAQCAPLEALLDGKDAPAQYLPVLKEHWTKDDAVKALKKGYVLKKLARRVIEYSVQE